MCGCKKISKKRLRTSQPIVAHQICAPKETVREDNFEALRGR